MKIFARLNKMKLIMLAIVCAIAHLVNGYSLLENTNYRINHGNYNMFKQPRQWFNHGEQFMVTTNDHHLQMPLNTDEAMMMNGNHAFTIRNGFNDNGIKRMMSMQQPETLMMVDDAIMNAPDIRSNKEYFELMDNGDPMITMIDRSSPTSKTNMNSKSVINNEKTASSPVSDQIDNTDWMRSMMMTNLINGKVNTMSDKSASSNTLDVHQSTTDKIGMQSPMMLNNVQMAMLLSKLSKMMPSSDESTSLMDERGEPITQKRLEFMPKASEKLIDEPAKSSLEEESHPDTSPQPVSSSTVPKAHQPMITMMEMFNTKSNQPEMPTYTDASGAQGMKHVSIAPGRFNAADVQMKEVNMPTSMSMAGDNRQTMVTQAPGQRIRRVVQLVRRQHLSPAQVTYRLGYRF